MSNRLTPIRANCVSPLCRKGKGNGTLASSDGLQAEEASDDGSMDVDLDSDAEDIPLGVRVTAAAVQAQVPAPRLRPPPPLPNEAAAAAWGESS